MSVEQSSNETVNIEESVVEFVPLLHFEEDYEILNQHPFTIRKKSNHKALNESTSRGYIIVHLKRRNYDKHRLIATQFIPNPDNLPEVDHINHDRTDYHLSNLRWVSRSSNLRNKSIHNDIVYEYVDKISDEAIVVDEYNGHELTDYYFHDDIFYFFNGIRYRKLHINRNKYCDSLSVNMIDNEGKRIRVMYSKFKKLHDLL